VFQLRIELPYRAGYLTQRQSCHILKAVGVSPKNNARKEIRDALMGVREAQLKNALDDRISG
jgi:hypothetical protein